LEQIENGAISREYVRWFAAENFDMYKLAHKYDNAFKQIHDISTDRGWYSRRSNIGPITRAV
jgi:hypothetical protein